MSVSEFIMFFMIGEVSSFCSNWHKRLLVPKSFASFVSKLSSMVRTGVKKAARS